MIRYKKKLIQLRWFSLSYGEVFFLSFMQLNNTIVKNIEIQYIHTHVKKKTNKNNLIDDTDFFFFRFSHHHHYEQHIDQLILKILLRMNREI